MTARDVEAMGLDPHMVRRRIAFLESYGRTVERELAVVQDRVSGEADRSSLVASDQHADLVWTLRMDAATAFRDAAQWAVYLDLPRTQENLLNAAGHYLSADQSYGAYLASVALGPSSGSLTLAGQLLDLLVAEMTIDEAAPERVGVESSDEVRRPRRRSGPALPPSQAAYAFLVASADRRISELRRQDVSIVARESPHRRSVAPVGSLGTALRSMWAIGHALQEPDELGSSLRELLRSVARRYEDAMSRAQASPYLWRNGVSPVDVGNIELVGIAALTAGGRAGNAVLEPLIEELGLVAGAPLRAGVALADLYER